MEKKIELNEYQDKLGQVVTGQNGVKEHYREDKVEVMGCTSGKPNKSEPIATSVRNTTDEMNSRGKASVPPLEIIPEKEQLLDQGDVEDSRERTLLWLNRNDDKEHLSEHLIYGGHEGQSAKVNGPFPSVTNNNVKDTIFSFPKPHSIINLSSTPTSGFSYEHGSFLSEQPEIADSKTNEPGDETMYDCGSPVPRARVRRASVQFADEDVFEKRRPHRRITPPINPPNLLGVPSGDQRRSTLGNIYEQGADKYNNSRRGSMPPNLQRDQLGRGSSKKIFTVVNYGNVGNEASETVPTGKESVTILELLDIDETTSLGPSLQCPDLFPGCHPNHSRDREGFEENGRHIENIGGGRRVSVVHVSNVTIPPVAIKLNTDDGDDDIDGSVFVEIDEPTQCNRSKQIQAMVSRGQDYGHRKKDRLVNKDGVINIRSAKISKRNYQFMLDLFTTLLDLQWRWVWILFAVAFLASWFGFGLVWWLIAWTHGDFEPRTGNSPPPCVDNLQGFPTALLYSIETQHTIGYGGRALSSECPLAFVTLMVQSLLGVIVQCIMAGVVFAKLAKPKNRSETIMFSRTANICLEDGDYNLVFRVGDMRRSQLVGCIIRAFLVRRYFTQEGRQIPFHTSHLHVQAECEEHDQSLFLAWPTRIIHRITPDSPLWRIGEADLLKERFEIIVVLEATIESSGMTTQIRTSYLPSEIKWGETFLPLFPDQKSNAQVVIDFSNFHRTEPQSRMPSMSAMGYAAKTAGPFKNRCGSCRSSSMSIRSRADSCFQGSRYIPSLY